MVVITGASAGVGRATVRAFARQRADIGLLAGGATASRRRGARWRTWAAAALVLPTDVADPDQVEAAAAAVDRAFGPVDVWVNDAMLSVFSPVKRMKPEEYRRVTEVTYLGYVYGTLAALRRMLPRDEGIIIQVGSALAYRGIPLQSAYLRRQARDPGVLRLAPCRADPRRQPRPAHDGADAGAEHAAIRLGEEPAAPQAAAGPADLPARGRGRGDRLGGRPRPPRARRRLAHGRGDRRQQDRAGLARPLPRPPRLRQPDDRRARGPRPAGQPVGARPRRPRGPRALRRPRPIVELAALGRHCTAAGWPRPAAASPGSPSRPSRPALAGRLRPVPSRR